MVGPAQATTSSSLSEESGSGPRRWVKVDRQVVAQVGRRRVASPVEGTGPCVAATGDLAGHGPTVPLVTRRHPAPRGHEVVGHPGRVAAAVVPLSVGVRRLVGRRTPGRVAPQGHPRR